jgi:hypothetical protein
MTKDREAWIAKMMARMKLEKLEGRDAVDANRKALARIQGLPTARILSISQYLQEQIIPAVKKRSGDQSKELELFTEIVDLLSWSILSDERADYFSRQLGMAKLEREVLLDRLRLAEAELLKYQTLEDLYTTDFLDHYAEGVRKRMADIKKKS